ncbi:MAG: phosphoenolpyruvate carboxylase [Lentimicrobium sp.]|nr:phosphoenolpyruvate carboxylase [Lentimicrobium sp.]MDD2527192.1 phosphoenolpyruvate carboxylase [Lentimicrobiaceae bacterium]MDD4596634.1 phosphoenolpyruvate carboxylase [Lentimicrobiaceae bacterium]MDY0025489.1 phosphoenolpyruvate carboxylase [Lentimicrobium sp.]
MYQSARLKVFEKQVANKFNLYNSLFLNLPYQKDDAVGILLPLLYRHCKRGLEQEKDPDEILDDFFTNIALLNTEKERVDFMFSVIQFVERQVVLFDSVEDAAFNSLRELGNYLSVKDFFQKLESRKNWRSIIEKLTDFSARIVFTAHPTQFYTPAALDIISRLRTLINNNQIDEIELTLQQLGLTSLMNAEKPTPLDEARNIIYFMRNVYYHAAGELYTYIKESVRVKSFENPGIIRLGFWPGGDRDGNPYVTAEITQAVADELRMTLMKCYYNDLKDLDQKITFKKVIAPLNELKEKLYTSMFDAKVVLDYTEIIQPLSDIREMIVANYHSLYLKDVDNLMDKVKVFRTHFATLDIRQDHSIHQQVLTEILKKAGLIKNKLNELSRDELIKILLEADIDATLMQFDDEVVNDTIKNIGQLKSIQQKNGEPGCNRYIISNSSDIFGILNVYAFFRWSGWQGPLTFDIIPLFETMEGMNNAAVTMQELFDIPAYRKHLKRRNDCQTIMLGFSDGTKDGGYLKANWEIFRSKEILSGVCKKNNIKAIFFDGRGGPPARGGGKTYRFYAAQTREIANNEIQLTIQGQTISSKYGTREQFMHHSEQLLTAGLSNYFSPDENVISDSSRKLLDELARISFEKYTALKNHAMFLPYLENKSTLRYYSKTNITSRPGKRGSSSHLKFTDLRAISFVGSWSQLKQNVPGYFGTGTALKSLIEAGNLEALKALFNEVGFFRTLVLNSMMSLLKCNFNLTRYIQKDEAYREFWNILYDEYLLSTEMLLKITGYTELMQEEPISRESIKIREKIVLPLLVIQQYALQKVTSGDQKDVFDKLATRSLYGNINASRNSA